MTHGSLERALHLAGTTAALVLAGTALARRKPGLLLLAPLAGCAPALVGHLLVERPRSAAPARRIPRDPLPDRTLALRRDPYRFILRRARRFGADLFRTRIRLRRTVCLTGPEAARLFYHPSRFVREGAPRLRLQAALFDRGGVQGLDDEAHRRRKQMFLSMMTPAAVQRLVDIVADRWWTQARRWAAYEDVVLYEQAQEILARAVCAWAGVPLREGEAHRRALQLTRPFDAAGAVGPRRWWSRLSRRAAHAWITEIVERIRAGSLRVPEHSPVHIVTSHRDVDGNLLSPKIAAVEILEVLRPTVAVAVYVTFIAHALEVHPESRERIAAGDEAYVERFVQEVRRFYPFFPSVTARTRHALEWQGYHFPACERVILDLHGTNHDPRAWDAPDRFDPDRFLHEGADPYSLVPQGGGDLHVDHRCPGERITLALMRTAARFLARELRYEVPPQDLAIDYTRLPALPRSHFVMRNVRRSTEIPSLLGAQGG